MNHLMKAMHRRLSLVACAVLALGAPGLQAQTAVPAIQVPTEEQLAQFPNMTGFKLSPDGRHLLAIESKGDVRNILVWKTDGLAAKPTVIGSSAMRIEAAAFLKNDMLSVTLSQPYDSRLGTGVEKTFIRKLLITDLEGKVWKAPLEAAGTARTELDDRLRALASPSIMSRMLNDPDHVVVESDGFSRDRDLFRYNIRTGQATRIMRIGDKVNEVLVDGKGVPYARSQGGSDGKGVYITAELRNPSSGDWEEHFRTYMKDRDVIAIVGRTAQPHVYILESNVGREVTGLYEYDAVQRKILGAMFEHRFFDAYASVSRFGTDLPEVPPIDGFRYAGPYGNEVHWIDPQIEAVMKGMEQTLGLKQQPVTLTEVGSGKTATAQMPSASLQLVGYHQGETPTYLFRVSGMNHPTEHYLLRGQQLTLLAKERPQLDRRALGNSSFIYYKARDGLNIPAILTVPNPQLCGPGPYSAVVHPHGGPWSRDTMQYDAGGWVPLLVSRCRVVLQPQFRGSADWGRTLWLAGDTEWGQKMQDDKDDGAQWLVSQKLADPKRIAMFGFSYGGYASMAAAVRPNGHYKCAIAGAGVSDIEKIWSDFFTNPYFRERQEPTVRGLSPGHQADKIQIPIMVYHGDRDQIVPLVQSEMFVNKARASGQKVDYHVLKDYAHGPSWTRETMAQQLKLISNYLDKGCGGSGL